MEQQGIAWKSIARNRMEYKGICWNSMEQQGIAWNNIARNRMEQQGIAWNTMARTRMEQQRCIAGVPGMMIWWKPATNTVRNWYAYLVYMEYHGLAWTRVDQWFRGLAWIIVYYYEFAELFWIRGSMDQHGLSWISMDQYGLTWLLNRESATQHHCSRPPRARSAGRNAAGIMHRAAALPEHPKKTSSMNSTG